MLELTVREIEKLHKLNQDKELVEGLKKLFLKNFMTKQNNDVYSDAASYVALQGLERTFKELSWLSPEDKSVNEEKNMI